MLKKIALVLLLAACGGPALDAPTCEPVALPHATVNTNPCAYALPSGIACADVRVYADGVELPPEAYTLVCSSGEVVYYACTGKTVTATFGCVR